jgi:putative ABC transport system ATP-binding protein
MLRLERVSKTYRQGTTRIHALDRVSLEVPDGEFLSIMGPSGSGKSTLLHLLGGLDVADDGFIYFEDRNLARLSDDELTIFRRQNIGFVFQFFNLLPTLTAEENVALPLLLDGRRLRDVQPRVKRLLELVGLWDRRDHKPDALSGGEMQRVAIARGLVMEPMVLLADEPTGNLDSKTGEDILTLIKDAAVHSGQTVVMVTHDARAAGYGDRIVTMKDGQVLSALGESTASAAREAHA